MFPVCGFIYATIYWSIFNVQYFKNCVVFCSGLEKCVLQQRYSVCGQGNHVCDSAEGLYFLVWAFKWLMTKNQILPICLHLQKKKCQKQNRAGYPFIFCIPFSCEHPSKLSFTYCHILNDIFIRQQSSKILQLTVLKMQIH